MELSKSISAILFYRAEPISVGGLAKLLKHTEGEVRDALTALEGVLGSTGIRLIQNGEEVTLGTAPEASALIEAITKEELSKDLSRASLETLAIVLYKGPITRSEIDYIRGVNSTFILRNLLVRGLVEKIDNPEDQRSFLYKSTFQSLEYMGVTKSEELPEYHDAIAQLAQFVAGKVEVEKAAEVEGGTPGEPKSEEETVADDIASEVSDIDDEEIADVLEEDQAGGGFDDAALAEHTEEDRNLETP